MGIELCKKCDRLHYVPGPCPPPRSVTTQSGGVKMTAFLDPIPLAALVEATEVDKATREIVKRGRPKTITDMKAYKRQKAKERRERERAAREGK